jgi:hypothetical protein
MKRVSWWCVLLGGLTVLSGAVGAGCQGEDNGHGTPETSSTSARVYSAAEVRRQFRRHDLPLTELTYDGPGPRVFHSGRAGPVFQVDVYRTVATAAASEGLVFYLKPANYRVRGEVMTKRKGNVVVIFERGRPSVRRRLDAALESLD